MLLGIPFTLLGIPYTLLGIPKVMVRFAYNLRNYDRLHSLIGV